MSSDTIRIDTEKLDGIAQQLSQLGTSLSTISLGITGIAATASIVVSEQPGIIRNLYSLKNRVSLSSAYAQRLSTGVYSVSAAWAEAEAKATCQNEAGEDPFSDGGSGSGGNGNTSNSIWNFLINLLREGIGGTGALGGAAAALWAAIAGDSGKEPWEILVDLGGVGGNLIWDSVTGTDWLESVFGLGYKTVGEFVTDGFSNPVTWTVEGIKAFVDNFEYAENGNYARFVTETVTETGVNVALGVGATAAVAAALAAAGVSAPVLVVGAAGAGVVYVVNEASKAVFDGKNVAQVAGEAVGDLTDWAVAHPTEAALKGVQYIVCPTSMISDAASAACDWFIAMF